MSLKQGLVFGLLFLAIFAKESKAVLPPVNRQIDLVEPSATPTVGLYKRVEISIVPISTVKITPTMTATPTLTEITTEETITPGVTKAEEPVVTPEITVPTETVNNDNTNRLTFWFLIVTIGLLAVIIIVQAWPRSEEEN